MSEPLGFKFSVPDLPEGRAVTWEELEREVLERLENDSSARKQSLWDLAVIYSMTGRQDQSLECLNKVAVLTDGPEEQARCYLMMGQLREQVNDYEGAVVYYGAAFGMEPQNTGTWYWINNNLGYSLVQLARCQEAEAYLRRAITIQPAAPNAYKNLGLAFLGENRFAEAGDYFIRSTQANASDKRSLAHLEQLLEAHPEIAVEIPDFNEKIEGCRMAVKAAAAAQPNLADHWKKLRKHQTKPWWAFWR
jgi:tetratricopeptide (TPR) repeat protein